MPYASDFPGFRNLESLSSTEAIGNMINLFTPTSYPGMKHWLFCFFLLWSGLLYGQASRWAIGPEIGTGAAFMGCCSDGIGFHTFGVLAEYRLARNFSVETNLRYTALESDLYSYSSGNRYSFGGFQHLRGLALTVGPRLNLPLRNALEIGVGVRAGVMPAWVGQEVTNFARPYQSRHYKISVFAALAAEARLAWWFAERMAVEWIVGYWAAEAFKKNLTLKSESGKPLPPDNSASSSLSEFVQRLHKDPTTTGALTLGMGLRFRL